MKCVPLVACFVLLLLSAVAQHNTALAKNGRKGTIYGFWGWNWDWYGKSNIRFTGTDYHFTLDQVAAQDRQSKFSSKLCFNPSKSTIQQVN